MIDASLESTKQKFLHLLAEKFPSRHAVFTEIINLQAILNLPKATEHFMSDIHGEYEAFYHILNNCSGVVRERVVAILGEELSQSEISDLCTLIYYPHERLAAIREKRLDTPDWYRTNLLSLIHIARILSNNYTRSKVRRAMPVSYAYIIDELLHEAGAKYPERHDYHVRILDSIVEVDAAEDFIVSLSSLIKRLAVDHLHVVGDLWDRGAHGDRVIDRLMEYHSVDIQWGNHDFCWMGAAAGSAACVANVVRINVRNNTLDILEGSYGISLRELALFAEHNYKTDEVVTALEKAISVIYFKLESQLIDRHPELDMNERRLLHNIDLANATVRIGDKQYKLRTVDFPTLNPEQPYELTTDEQRIIENLVHAFKNSDRLKEHIEFLYEHGSVYKVYNNNLIFHGCIPMKQDGTFQPVRCLDKTLSGKPYLDFCDYISRRAWFEGDQDALDWMLYLSSGQYSTASGRVMKTFERCFVEDRSQWEEPQDPYWELAERPSVCNEILMEFGVDPNVGHIINGHTPVLTARGEKPVRAGGKFLIIDGGFCEKYHSKTGIAGYTLVSDDWGMRIKAHLPFESVEAAIAHNADIEESSVVEITRSEHRLHISDTDIGEDIRRQIRDLQALLEAYRNGDITERVNHH